uniref:neuroglobin-like n=1 Tax=Myxine glutinosa TaxID=7769 RepID=UPI00358E2BAD
MMNFLRFFERRKAPCQESSSSKGAEGHEDSLVSPAERPNEAQRELVKDSWRALQQDIARVGVIIFVRLFETHPECKDIFFQFRDMDDLHKLKRSRQLKAHGLRVMSFIEKTVARLEQEAVLEALILDLGRKHYRYNAAAKYYMFVGLEFIDTIRPFFEDKWTTELEEAWKALFRYLTWTMSRGYRAEEQSGDSVKSTAEEQPPPLKHIPPV